MEAFSRNDTRAVLAEFLGTMFFVFLGTGAVVAAVGGFGGSQSGTALLVIAVAHGLGYLVAVAWTANISGGHINPAVSLAMIITKNISATLGATYIAAQLAGAAAASLLLKLTTNNDLESLAALGAHRVSPDVVSGEALLLEVIATAFLVLVIYNVAVSNKGWGSNAPIIIGLAVVSIHFVAVPFTGASVNPARSFGPALVANEWADFWIYVVGPGVGAIMVAIGWMFWKDLGDSLDENSLEG